jgi:hypothetical protein
VQGWLTRTIHELQTGGYIEPTKATLAEYLTQWLESLNGVVRPSTIIRYERHVRNHVAPAIGHIPLNKVTPLALQNLYGGKRLRDSQCTPFSACTGCCIDRSGRRSSGSSSPTTPQTQ